MLDANISTDKNSCDPASKEVEFMTREEQQKIFSDFLIKRRREEQRRYSVKHSNKQKTELLNNFEDEIDNEESDYEDDIDIDKYIDDFENETRK